ncbi:MAG TPA: hypothetical protein VFS21_08895 [Roseiflexaceae bacterium]|nr:hypothetical protein [Roseiflexaceae bacterium]
MRYPASALLLTLCAALLAGCGQPLQLNPVSGGPPGTGSLSTQTTSRTTTATLDSGGAGVFETAPPPLILTPADATPAQSNGVAPAVSPAPDALARWQDQQLERADFPEPRTFVAQRPVDLLWFDPLSGRRLVIGQLIGAFPAQASFTLRATNQPALLVRYEIDKSFGLTAISPVLKQRMQAAGVGPTTDAYVILSTDIAQTP